MFGLRNGVFVVCFVLLQYVENYKFRLFDESDLNFCDLQKCGNRLHTMCYLTTVIGKKCNHFEYLEMTSTHKRNIMLGHNGLRNRVARTKETPISNMNYLHWDDDLAEMARRSIIQCERTRDECDYIYTENITVGENWMFSSTVGRRPGTNAIRTWFLQGKDFPEKYLYDFPGDYVTNYSQLIWPTTEFVGCSMAKMFGGYSMICFYSPKINVLEGGFKLGHPCSNCPQHRPTCSRLFSGICGIDNVNASVAKIYKQINLLIGLILVTILNLL